MNCDAASLRNSNGIGLIFHPENIFIGDNVYVGHYAILKAYFKNAMRIGDGCWIKQAAFLHAAGGVTLGRRVGIGPHACVLTFVHDDVPRGVAIMDGPLKSAPVTIGDGTDVGIGAVILPGVTIGEGVQVGAATVVRADVPAYVVVVRNPGRVVKTRQEA